MAVEIEVLNRLKPGIITCREKQYATSIQLLKRIVEEEELHLDHLQTHLELMDKLEQAPYSAQCVSGPPT